MNPSQYRKFCKCVADAYQFLTVYQWGCSIEGQDYEYTDAQDNLNWDAVASPWPYDEHLCPVKSVKCGDGNVYETDKDYYYPPG
jgi:hypothetical protein